MKKKKQPTWDSLSDTVIRFYDEAAKQALKSKPSFVSASDSNVGIFSPLNAVSTASSGQMTNPSSTGMFYIKENILVLNFHDGSTHQIPVEGAWPEKWIDTPPKPAPKPPEDVEPWTPPLTVEDTFV